MQCVKEYHIYCAAPNYQAHGQEPAAEQPFYQEQPSLGNNQNATANYILYKVTTDPLSWTIYRKDMDFYQLRKILLK